MADAVSADSAALKPPAAPTAESYSRTYVRYAMWLLLAIYVVNFLNRQIITILAEPIKLELNLADWQLGLVTGLAFAFLYTILGIPIARVAEHANRPRIISAAAVVWSGFTLLCAVAGNFWQLLLCRLGMGAGIAGCTPPAHSLIVDYHPLEKRASAIAFYSLGSPFGALVGLVMGGLVYDAYGWRVAFVVAGLPGLLLGLVAFFTLREPRRALARHAAKAAASAATFGQTLAYLSQRRTYWYVAAGTSFLSFASGAAFMPSFYLRNHTAEVARLANGLGLEAVSFLGLAIGLTHTAGAVGVWSSGWITDKFGGRDLRNYTIAPAVAALLAIPIRIAMFGVDSAGLSLALLTVATFLGALWWGPVFSVGQSVVPPQMRATSAAILLFIINIVSGLGPLGIGALSDAYNQGLAMGPGEGIRWALISMTGLGLAAFACFWRARRTIRADFLG